MKKLGRPTRGEKRKLSRAEVRATGLDHGLYITDTPGVGIHFYRLANQRAPKQYTAARVHRAIQRLEEYWETLTGNGKEL